MSTHVHTAHPEFHSGTYLSLDAYRSEVVNVGIGSGPEGGVRSAGINVPRADLLAAISSELGVLIIDKADLPAVAGYNATHDMVGVMALSKGSDPAALRREAFRYLAYAEHLERNPPVDEAQVDALAATIAKATGTPPYAYIAADLTPTALARSIIASGDFETRS